MERAEDLIRKGLTLLQHFNLNMTLFVCINSIILTHLHLKANICPLNTTMGQTYIVVFDGQILAFIFTVTRRDKPPQYISI
jgi:hypothetical protein